MSSQLTSPVASSVPILSVDLGRTATKAAISRDPDNVVLIPANVAHLPIEQVRQGGFESSFRSSLLDIRLEYQGKGYALGQLAADFGAGLGAGQSKVEDALVKVFAAIGYFGMTGDLALVLSLPYHSQDEFDREKDMIVSLVKSPHVMIYRGESVAVNIKQVWVMPEGYGSLIWSAAQEPVDPSRDLTKVSLAIVDIGHQTTDLLMTDRFRFARGISKSLPFGMNQFYEQVAAQIQGADSQSMILIEAVNRPLGERFYRPRGVARPTNLDELLPSLSRSFARDLTGRILEWLPERATDVLICGGGGEFFWSDLQPPFAEAQLRAHLAQPSRKANALGQYLYGELQLTPSK